MKPYKRITEGKLPLSTYISGKQIDEKYYFSDKDKDLGYTIFTFKDGMILKNDLVSLIKLGLNRIEQDGNTLKVWFNGDQTGKK